jgi:hypothetical protein
VEVKVKYLYQKDYKSIKRVAMISDLVHLILTESTIKGYKLIKAPKEAVLVCVKMSLKSHYGDIKEYSNMNIEFIPLGLRFQWDLFQFVCNVKIDLERCNDFTKLTYLITYGRIKPWLLLLSAILILIPFNSRGLGILNAVWYLFCFYCIIWGGYSIFMYMGRTSFDRFFNSIVNHKSFFKYRFQSRTL